MEDSFNIRKPTRLRKYDYNSVDTYFVTTCTKKA